MHSSFFDETQHFGVQSVLTEGHLLRYTDGVLRKKKSLLINTIQWSPQSKLYINTHIGILVRLD